MGQALGILDAISYQGFHQVASTKDELLSLEVEHGCKAAKEEYERLYSENGFNAGNWTQALGILNAISYQESDQTAATRAELLSLDLCVRKIRNTGEDLSDMEKTAKEMIDRLKGKGAKYPDAFAFYVVARNETQENVTESDFQAIKNKIGEGKCKLCCVYMPPEMKKAEET